jgi:hypothetical protein
VIKTTKANYLSKRFQRAPRPGSYKGDPKYQGRISYNILVAILENQCLHKFILSLIDL